jgi:cytochrome c-type biogenesis protein CcmH
LSIDAWIAAAAAIALILIAVGVVLGRRGGKVEAARAAEMQQRIDAARAQLAELRSRHGSDDATLQAEQERLAGVLLAEVADPAPPAAERSRVGRYRMAAFCAAAVATVAAAVLLAMRPAATSPATGVAASSVTAPRAANAGPSASAPPARALSDEQLEHMVEEANEQLRKTPDDAHVLAMLAHSYDMLGRFAESSKAYASLARLKPRDAQVLADYADALAVANGRTLAGEPTALIERALAIDAGNAKALALAGTAAFERKDYDQAVSYWERARAASLDETFKHDIETSIAEAKAARDGKPIGTRNVARGSDATGTAASLPGRVAGRVTLADDLVSKVSPDATVFVYARPAHGSQMPVALLRKQVRDLPIDFTLDDSMAMVPGVTLSQAGTVVIGARISSRGDVTPQPGDVQGWSAPVDVGTTGIKLEMSEVLK